jgi:Zn finger protein HypA/HybF involved in hydrogenase expression
MNPKNPAITCRHCGQSTAHNDTHIAEWRHHRLAYYCPDCHRELEHA